MNARAIRILVLLVLGPVMACSSTWETPEALMKNGLDALYVRSDPEAAVKAFRKVLAKNPEHYVANFQLAVALDRAGKPAEALPRWEKSLAMAAEFGRRLHLPRFDNDEFASARPAGYFSRDPAAGTGAGSGAA